MATNYQHPAVPCGGGSQQNNSSACINTTGSSDLYSTEYEAIDDWNELRTEDNYYTFAGSNLAEAWCGRSSYRGFCSFSGSPYPSPQSSFFKGRAVTHKFGPVPLSLTSHQSISPYLTVKHSYSRAATQYSYFKPSVRQCINWIPTRSKGLQRLLYFNTQHEVEIKVCGICLTVVKRRSSKRGNSRCTPLYPSTS